ncbi:MAG: hypothetical protein GY679_01020 [Mycoplasma sp.]|nr:hypothetical protein [Mycoplasma sp.]
MRKLEIKTISNSFNKYINTDPAKVEIFNFELNKININLSKTNEEIVGTGSVSWIRIFDNNNNYYDFITSSLFYVSNSEGVLLLCSEDSEYISFEYISKLIEDFMEKLKEKNAIDSEKYMLGYTKALSKELKEANKNLEELYNISAQTQNTRLSMEDSLNYAKLKLEKRYLIGIIAKKLIKENGKEILEILKNN